MQQRKYRYAVVVLRVANALFSTCSRFRQVKGSGVIDKEISIYALEALNIDQHGLDEMDNRILTTIIDKFSGSGGLSGNRNCFERRPGNY